MPERRQRGRPRAFHDKTEQNTIQSLDRALTILETLGQAGGLSLTELASTLDQSPATVYRVLTTLEQHGVAELEPATQKWHIGAGAFRIGSAFLRRTNLVDRARPVMQALMQATGETANLGVENGARVLFVSQVETHASIRAFFPPGTQSPLHASGIGKALLAQRDPAQIDAVIDTGLERFTKCTLTDRDALLADLRTIRQRGYAIDDEERNDGMRCVASPVFNATGVAVAGLSISGPTARVSPDRINEMAARVCDAAATLSQRLGAP
ncbi:MAG: HTH-type transcriptional regulator BhcR [Pseudomonadota bacterium]